MTTEREPVDESRSLGALQVAEAEARVRYPEHDPTGRADFIAGAEWGRVTEAARYRGLVEAAWFYANNWWFDEYRSFRYGTCFGCGAAVSDVTDAFESVAHEADCHAATLRAALAVIAEPQT